MALREQVVKRLGLQVGAGLQACPMSLFSPEPQIADGVLHVEIDLDW